MLVGPNRGSQCFLKVFALVTDGVFAFPKSPHVLVFFVAQEVSSLTFHGSFRVAESEGLHLAKSVGHLWKLRGYQDLAGAKIGTNQHQPLYHFGEDSTRFYSSILENRMERH